MSGTWASKGFFQWGGALEDFPKFFQGGQKWWSFIFPHSKLKNNLFAEYFKIQGGQGLHGLVAITEQFTIFDSDTGKTK